MIDAMLVRGFAVRTQRSYLGAVQGLAKYYRRSPDRLDSDDIQAYFLYLVKDRRLAPASCRLSLNGIRFLYKEVLHREFEAKIQVPKRPQKIPELLRRKEVAAILAACSNRKHRMLLTVCYGCGRRVSELLYQEG
jgi:site-specific recombinase XerD